MDTKNFLQSKGIWGILISALGAAFANGDIAVTETDLDIFLTILMQIGGLVIAFYGRLSASAKLTFGNPNIIKIDTSKLPDTDKRILIETLEKSK